MNSMTPIRTYLARYMHGQSLDKFVLDNYSEEILNKILDAEKKGKKIYIGHLDSDNEAIETFFCIDSFIINNDSFYLNSIKCIW
jgi:hypothetical protein